MFDIIGFWTTITLLTIILMSIHLFILYWVGNFVILQVTEDSVLTNKLMGKFFKNHKHDSSLLFNKIVVHDIVVLFTCLFSIIVWIVSIMGYHRIATIMGYHNTSLFYNSYVDYAINQMAKIAEDVASPTGSVIVLIAGYFLTIYLLRKVYKFTVRVNNAIK